MPIRPARLVVAPTEAKMFKGNIAPPVDSTQLAVHTP